MVDEEKIMAEKIDGVVIAVPATRLTFYLERVRGITGKEEISVTPLVIPESPMKGIVEAIKRALGKKEKKLESSVG